MQVLVINNHRARGLETVDGLFSGRGKDNEPVYDMATSWELADALAESFDTAACFVSYSLQDADGDRLPHGPRVNKGALTEIRALGGEVSCGLVAIDFDFEAPGGGGKWAWADMTPDEQETWAARMVNACPAVGLPSVVYATKHGCRFVHQLAFDVPAGPSFEAILQRFMAAYREIGFAPDPACKDWTRLFFCPRIVKNDVDLGAEDWFFIKHRPDEFYIPEDNDLVVREETALPMARVDAECPDNPETLFLEKESLLGGVFHKEHPSYSLVHQTTSLEVTGEEGHNTALLTFVGSVCRALMPCAWASPEIAYAAVWRAASLLKTTTRHPDWAPVAWRMVKETWGKRLAQATKEKTEAAATTESAAYAAADDEVPTRRLFDSCGTQIPEDPEDLELVRDKKTGQPIPIVSNVRKSLHILGMVPEIDDFKMRDQVRLPDGSLVDLVGRRVLDIRERAMSLDLSVPKGFFEDAVFTYAFNRTYHPVRDYLFGLKWDGKPRVDTWIFDYLGTDPSNGTPGLTEEELQRSREFLSMSGRVWLIAAVRRILQPGWKFDELPILEGPQGTLKSTVVRTLAVRPEWFSDHLPLGSKPKEVIEFTSGKWIIEAQELAGLRKKQEEDLKSFLSRTEETARMSYDRGMTTRQRQFMIMGTTNQQQYLKDPTGNRRYWPILVGDVRIDALRQDIDQIWAEAVHLEALNEATTLSPSLYAAEELHQRARELDDPYYDELLGHLPPDREGRISNVCIYQILALSDANRRSHEDAVRVRQSMEKLGWVKGNLQMGGQRARGYHKGASQTTWKMNPQGTKLIEDKSK